MTHMCCALWLSPVWLCCYKRLGAGWLQLSGNPPWNTHAHRKGRTLETCSVIYLVRNGAGDRGGVIALKWVNSIYAHPWCTLERLWKQNWSGPDGPQRVTEALSGRAGGPAACGHILQRQQLLLLVWRRKVSVEDMDLESCAWFLCCLHTE